MCGVAGGGGGVFRKAFPFCPLAAGDALQERKLMPERFVHESGEISIWLQRQPEDLGLAEGLAAPSRAWRLPPSGTGNHHPDRAACHHGRILQRLFYPAENRIQSR